MDEQQARLAELTEYTRIDLARRDREQLMTPGASQQVHIHHHYPPPAAPAPVPQMDIASRYAGHFVLLLGGMIVLAGVAVVFVMIAQALMVAAVSLAVCAVAGAAAVHSLRMSKTDADLMKQRLAATTPPVRGRRGR